MVDDSGDIFIADTGNHRIRLVTPDGVIHSIAGTGAAGFAGDGGPATAALLNGPQGLFLDGAGDLYFADTGNNRIRRLVPDPVAPAPVIQSTAITVVNAISLREGAVAPGEIAAIFGTGLGPDAGVTGALDAAGLLPATLGGVEVRFDGTAAPIFYAQSGQVNVQVPYTVAGSETVAVEVRYQGKLAGAASVPVAPSAPAMLALATNPDGSPNAESAPAPRSTWMTFYATGEGLTDGPNVAGKPAAGAVSASAAADRADHCRRGCRDPVCRQRPGDDRRAANQRPRPRRFRGPGRSRGRTHRGHRQGPPITIWLK